MRKYKYILGRKHKNERKRVLKLHPFMAFDCETDEDGNFVYGYFAGEKKDSHNKEKYIEYGTDKLKDFQDFFMSFKNIKQQKLPLKFIGFNVDFDLAYLEDQLDNTTRIESNNFITVRSKNGIPVYDISNFSREYSLLEWYDFLKNDKEFKFKFDLNSKEWLEWYELKKKEKEDLNLLTKYQWKELCKFDTRFTWELANYLENFFVNECSIPMSFTVGSCALNLYNSRFAKEVWMRNSDEVNDFERLAYRGGRCECFIRGKQKVESYDINSMYLSILRDYEFPNPCTILKDRNNNFIRSDKYWRKFYNEGNLMIMECEVEVPQQKIAPLPFYDKNKKKLLFPCGKFEGVFTSVELKEAEKYGIKIIQCKRYIAYNKLRNDYYFKEFASFVFDKRKKYKEKNIKGMDVMIKKIGNSFYGKLGQHNYPQNAKWIPLEEYHGEMIDRLIKERNGKEYIYLGSGQPKVDSMHTFPCIAVFVTSYARIKLLRKMKEYEDKIVYCDTDSLFLLSTSDKSLIKDSNRAGEFKFEGIDEYIFYRPKFYSKKIKGVPKRAQKIFEDEKEIHFKYKKPLKRNESIRKDENQNKWVEIKKVIQKEDDKRIWTGNYSLPLEIYNI